jgi:hypothetical protein
MRHHFQLLFLRWALTNFVYRLPSNCGFPISISQLARTGSVSQHTQLFILFNVFHLNTSWLYKYFFDRVLVADACNHSYLGGWDQKDHTSRLAQANSLQGPTSKRTRAKCTRGVTQTVECVFCKHEELNSNPSPTKIDKQINKISLAHRVARYCPCDFVILLRHSLVLNMVKLGVYY